MADFKKYLAEQVLSEDKLVTYRTLSRALKVHVNVAKQMLYEFHSWQNGKRPGAVHATYMVYGTKKVVEASGNSEEDGDVEMTMTSSLPEVESLAEETPIFTLSLVADEQLSDILSQYENVTAIHVYSLGSHPMKDLQLLAEVSKPILPNPTVDGSSYLGVIKNPYVRRRERRGIAANLPAQPVAKQAEAKPAAAKPAAASKIKEELKATDSTKEATPSAFFASRKKPSPPLKPTAVVKPTPPLKRGGSGGIMQSFAKAAAKPKKDYSSQPVVPSGAEDSLALSDDGEDDSEIVPDPKREDAGMPKSRKDRQDELRRMMEDEDEEEEDPEEKADTPMDEPEEEEPQAPEPDKEKAPEPAEVISSTVNGRRRGKRRVTNKKTVMDDQGYLVVVHEQGWESFSEDEPAAAPLKKQESTSQPTKPKKAAGKGQGNIMSFFSKK